MKFTRIWGAASLALAVASPALASGPVVAQMDARISNLQATFSDFRPDDGIDAGITWNSTYGGSATVICCRGFGGSTDTIDLTRHMSFNNVTPFDAIPTGVTMKQGNVAALSMQGGVQAKVSMDQSFFDDAVIAKGADTSNSARAYADVHGTTFALGLKPGTEVRLSAEISIDGLLDLTKQSTYGVASRNLSVYLNGSTYLGVSDAYGSADIEFLLQPPAAERFTTYSFNVEMLNGQVQPQDPTEVHTHKTFEYVIRNNGTQERWLQVGGSAQMNFNAYSYKSAVSPVPEPEGWGSHWLVGPGWIAPSSAAFECTHAVNHRMCGGGIVALERASCSHRHRARHLPGSGRARELFRWVQLDTKRGLLRWFKWTRRQPHQRRSGKCWCHCQLRPRSQHHLESRVETKCMD